MPAKALSDRGVRSALFGLWFKCGVAVIPALIFGKLFANFIESHMMNLYVVSSALVFGGIAIVLLESTERKTTIRDVGEMSLKVAVLIGVIQCLAMLFPGTSRSAATIIGAMLLGSSRTVAAEFSFFLASPTMAAASCYSLLKHGTRMDHRR
jgi:undecaprenyl-diphosphatase